LIAILCFLIFLLLLRCCILHRLCPNHFDLIPKNYHHCNQVKMCQQTNRDVIKIPKSKSRLPKNVSQFSAMLRIK
jgi:hypothetical protein